MIAYPWNKKRLPGPQTSSRWPAHASRLPMIAGAVFLALATADARADWRQDVDTFRIGIVGGEDVASAAARMEPFRLAVAEALGVNVEIFAASTAAALIDAHASARVDYAVYSATAYASAWLACECVEPLVIPKSADGVSSFRSVIISRPGGPQVLDEIEDGRVAGLARDSFAGHNFAVHQLVQQEAEIPIPIRFEADGEAAIGALMEGQVDALIGWSSLAGDPASGYSRGTLRLIARRNEGEAAGYQIIWQSAEVPHRPHAIRKELNGEPKQILRDLLVGLYDDDPISYDAVEPLFGGGFVVARHGQFNAVIDYVEQTTGISKDRPESEEVEE